jgi:hypothetical protein
MTDPNSAFVEEDHDDAHSGVIVHVPEENLAEGGVPPEEGDDVEFDVKGKVRYVENGIVCVTVSEVNGQPVEEPQEEQGQEQGEGEEDQEGQSLKSALQGAIGQGGY